MPIMTGEFRLGHHSLRKERMRLSIGVIRQFLLVFFFRAKRGDPVP